MISGSNTLRDALYAASLILNKIDNPKKEAVLLLAHCLDLEIAQVYSRADTIIEEEKFNHFLSICKMRNDGIPFQYITGKAEFMSIVFHVNEKVLIPRPETEHAVMEGLNFLNNRKNQKKACVLDLCTGSGCIAISIAKNYSNCNVVGSDISGEALSIAKKNSRMNHVEEKVDFIKSNMFENIVGKFDVIISNPPYICSDEILNLQTEVQKEPIIALDGGYDGLDFYRIIAENANKYLLNDGLLILEIGNGQAEQVTKLFLDCQNIHLSSKIYKDYVGINRILVFYKNCIQ